MERRLVWQTDDVLDVFSQNPPADAVVAFDFETTGLDPYADGAACVLLSLTYMMKSYKLMTVVLPLVHPESRLYRTEQNLPPDLRGAVRDDLARLGRWLCFSGKRLVAHHAKFDIKWWALFAGDLSLVRSLSRALVWDTQMAQYLLDENESNALKKAVPRIFGVEDWSVDLSIDGAALDIPLPQLAHYAALDTEWCYQLYLWQRGQLDEEAYDDELNQKIAHGLTTLMRDVAMPCVRSLAEQEVYGWAIDTERLHQELASLGERAQAAREMLVADGFFDSVDLVTSQAGAGVFKEATRRAVEWGDMAPTRKTPAGVDQWDKHVLREQVGSRFAPPMLELRKVTKAAEALRQWEEKAVDGVIHPTYHATRREDSRGNVEGTTTGRLSSSNPNMQQVNAGLKPMFVPHSPGLVVASLDYSQLELRLAADASESQPMLQAFRDGKDLHRMFAAVVTGKDESDVTKEERQKAKACNFGYLYGQQSKGFVRYANDVYGVHLDEDEAEAMREAWFMTWQGVAEWHARMIDHAHTYGAVWSPFGRVRHLPKVRSDVWGLRTDAERQAINSPIQSAGSDLLQLAVAMTTGTAPWLDEPMVPQARVLGTVHDEINVEIPADGYKEFVDRVERVMTIDVVEVLAKRFDWELKVPLTVGVSVGTRWGVKDVYDSDAV